MSDQLVHELVAARISKATRSVVLDEMALTPTYSAVHPNNVDLSTSIGPVRLNLALLSAPMDTVTHFTLAQKLSDAGGAGIITNTRDPAEQLLWLSTVLNHRPCLVKDPVTLYEDEIVGDAERILRQKGYSTVPVLARGSRLLKGVLFTRDVAFAWHRSDLVSKWMRPFDRLKIVSDTESFAQVRERLLNEPECNVLPSVRIDGTLAGMYFKKDVIAVCPSSWGGKPLVGIAVGMHESDVERVREAVKLGAGIVVIDSSHGDCEDGIRQVQRLAKICRGHCALIAGNVADVDGGGFSRLVSAGADAVKVGIGSGSICTTSTVTSAGVGMVTALIACRKMREAMRIERRPAIIADGGIEGPGHFVKATLVGADAIMGGKWFVAAEESLSVQKFGVNESGMVRYRGMASAGAIADRIAAARYGKHKTAPEGVEGYVPYRGPLMNWLPVDLEQARSGFAHAGADSVRALQNYGENPTSWTLWSPIGMVQQATRVTL